MLYRVKQFVWSIVDNFKPLDETIVTKYLDKDEKNLFNKLNKSEKHHSIRVCNNALNKEVKNNNIDKFKLAKIALLHDIGKTKYELNVIEKSALVILDKITHGKIKKYNNKKIESYYCHPKYSVDLLKRINDYDNDFLEAIEKHHYKDEINNEYLKIIKVCDDIS